jgi:uncharacterized membrane protein
MISFDFLNSLPPPLITFVVSALPIAELRGSIPLAIFKLGLSIPEAYFWSVLGNSLVGVLIVVLIEPISKLLRKLSIFEKFFDWLFERTRRKHSKKFEKYQALALFLFVAIPLPMTGAWSGAVAAFVFGVKKRIAIPTIILGVLAAGLIVTLISTGVIQLNGFLSTLFASNNHS